MAVRDEESSAGGVDPFLKFVYSIAQELIKENLKGMKFLCGIPKGVLEDVKDPLDLMAKLQEENKINEGDLSFLTELVETVGRSDLKSKIVEYERAKQEQKPLRTEISRNVAQSKATPRSLPHGTTPSPDYSATQTESSSAPLPPRQELEYSATQNKSISIRYRSSIPHSHVETDGVPSLGDTVDQTLTSSSQPQRDESHSGSITARSLMPSPQVVSDSQPEIRVRDYQAELIRWARTENSIVVAPTGSGKTLVAAELTRHHMMSSESPQKYTAIFLVDKVPLVQQQAEKLSKYLNPTLDWFKVDQLIGEKSAQLSVCMSENQAVVLTAQVLVNHLKGKGDCKTISLTSIDLLIFDECHHTHDNHPYNEIMNFYHDLKQRHPRGKLPKVIGLTASIGTGGKMTPEGALQHVYKICANLDCKRIVRVKENEAELAAHVTPPEANVQVVPSRPVDPFRARVVAFMQALEREYFEKQPLSHCQHGTQQYESWIQSMRSLMLQTSNREGEFCARCLIELSRALVVNDDCRTVDARTYFERFLNEIRRLKFEGGKALLRDRLSQFVEDLKAVEKTPDALVNPKLVYLEQLLLRRYADKPDSLCILFTKTRYSTQAFTKWINFNPRLCNLNATRLTGSSNDEDSMTKPQQQEVIDDFSKGISKIMIATTIAIQGLDIKACNTVIRYGLVTDEIAMVQARGRARAAASKVTAVHPSYREEQKERANEEKEELMEGALHEFEKIDPQVVAETTASLQSDSFRKREMVRAQEQQIDRGCRYDMTRIDFFCKECQSFLCRGDSIKKFVKTHTIVTDDAFKDNAEWSLLPPKTGSPASFDGVDLGGRLVCKKCNKSIGSVASKDKVSFPALSMKKVFWSHRDSPQKKETVGKATKKEFDKGFRDY